MPVRPSIGETSRPVNCVQKASGNTEFVLSAIIRSTSDRRIYRKDPIIISTTISFCCLPVHMLPTNTKSLPLLGIYFPLSTLSNSRYERREVVIDLLVQNFKYMASGASSIVLELDMLSKFPLAYTLDVVSQIMIVYVTRSVHDLYRTLTTQHERSILIRRERRAGSLIASQGFHHIVRQALSFLYSGSVSRSKTNPQLPISLSTATTVIVSTTMDTISD